MSVVNSNDSGPGSLRDLITNTSIYEITFDVSTINVNSPITIMRSVYIKGKVRINVMDDLFIQQAGTNVILERLEIDRVINGLIIKTVGTINYGTVLELRGCQVLRMMGGTFIDITDASLMMNRCYVDNGNASTLIRGQGTVDGTQIFDIRSCTFVGNTCDNILVIDSASSVLNYQAEVTLHKTVFHTNTVSNNLINITYSTDNTSGFVNMDQCRIESTYGTGSCLYIDLSSLATVDIIGTEMIDNQIRGIDIYSSGTGSRFVNIDNCLLQGGIEALVINSLEGEVTITNTTIAGHNTTATCGGISLLGNQYSSRIENVTIHGNTGDLAGGIITNRSFSPSNRMVNMTMVDNTGSMGGLVVISGTPFLSNCLIVNGGISGVVSSMSNNNLVDNVVDVTGIADGVNGNIVTSDPLIGSLGLYGGDNDMPVVPLLENSPAINAGNNANSNEAYDARGPPFVRIWPSVNEGGVIDIGAFQNQPFSNPCYLGSSMIKVRLNNEESIVRADTITSSHEVWDMESESYIPVVYNARIQGTTSIYLIPKGMYGATDDLYITSGHLVNIDGKTIKARDVPGSKRIKIDRSDVYSIVCDTWTPIWINGIGVYAWSKQKWLDRVRKTGIVWTQVRSQ